MPQLLNRVTGEYELAEVISPIAPQDLSDFQSHWLPPIMGRIEELKRAGTFTREALGEHNLEDFHWEWPRKCQERTSLEWNSFAVRCGGRTQGLMFVNMLRRCKAETHANQHMVYIDLVSTAPWNRPRLSGAPLYRGVGLVLVTEAVVLSKEEGFGGRIGLHGLPGAVRFYESECGMQNLGPDSAYGDLPYFEMTSAQAETFLST